jgi:uncharacterized delta-60 repeat protein
LLALAVALGLALLAPGAAGAAPGDLDPGFGEDGVVTTSFGGGSATANAVDILPNGKIVAAGGTFPLFGGNDFALARYLPDGSLDPVFDGDGKVTTDFSGSDIAESVAIQPDGRIVAVGGDGGDFALARYRRDGGLDFTFDGDGKVTTDLGGTGPDRGEDVAIQPDGKIVVVGTREVDIVGDLALVRYHPDGGLDAGFGADGIVVTALSEFGGSDYAVALQDDGRIVVAGSAISHESSWDFAVVRYNADGALDTSFDTDGIVLLDLGNGALDGALDLAIQSDGKIVVAGLLGNADFLLVRLNLDGSLDMRGLDPYLDAPFGTGGLVTTDFGGFDYATALAIASGGKLVAAGVTEATNVVSDLALARYNLDGSLDQTFGTGGKVATDLSDGWEDIADIALQGDGSIVAAGGATIDGVRRFFVARYVAAPCCVVGVGVPTP